MTDDRAVLDLFAGPGGWDQGVMPLGIRPRGVEWDAAACETGKAAGHERIQADVAELEPLAFGRVSGLIASPPCQGFSLAGKGKGRADTGRLLAVVRTTRRLRDLEDGMAATRAYMADHRSLLVLEPLRYALALTPSWLAWEQVPAVLPLWEACAVVLRRLGYTVATGNLQAEQFGVPQTRKRAILVARAPWLTAQLGPARLPEPTHSRYHNRKPWTLDLGVAPWVPMAEALGWGMTHRPYPTLASGRGSGGPDREKVGGSAARRAIYAEQEAGRWLVRTSVGEPSGERAGHHLMDPWERPSHTVTGRTRSWEVVPDAGQVQLRGAAGGTRPDTVRRADQPAPSLAFGNDWGRWGWELSGAGGGARDRIGLPPRAPEQPAHTITAKGTACWVQEAEPPAERQVVRISVPEAAVLQTFPTDYPWQGSATAQYRQIGDAVPPLLAQHVVAAVTGAALPAVTDLELSA